MPLRNLSLLCSSFTLPLTPPTTPFRGPMIKIGSIMHQRFQQQSSPKEVTTEQNTAEDLESGIAEGEGDEMALAPEEQALYYEIDKRDKVAFQNYRSKQAALREAKER